MHINNLWSLNSKAVKEGRGYLQTKIQQNIQSLPYHFVRRLEIEAFLQ